MSAAIGKKVGQNSVVSPAVSPRRRSQQLGINARKVVSKRYSLKDSKGQPFEEWADIVKRVVGHVSKAETGEKRDKFFAAMSEVMLAREFIPNTPCLVNAGKTKRTTRRLFCARRSGFTDWNHGTRKSRSDDSPDRRRHRHDL